MKKRMRRLLSALLVLAMLCAMVPAVLADDLTTITAGGNTNNEVFVGDTFQLSMPDGCAATHARTLVFETSAGKTVSGYLTYNTSTGKYTAAKTTLSTSATNTTTPGDYVIAKVGCNEKTCTNYKGTKDYKFTIYSKATSISTSTDSVTAVKDGSVMINASVLPVTGKQAITVTNDPSGVAEGSWADGKLTVTAKEEGTGYITLTADKGTTHEVSKPVTVTVIDSAIVTIKNGTTVVSQTGDTNKSTTVKKGTTLSLKAEVLASTGADTTVTWSSSSPSVASVTSSGVVTATKTGSAVIKATAADASAEYTVNVIDTITSVTLKDTGTDTDYSTEELDKGGSALTVTAVVDPTDAATYVVWSVTDDTVLNIAKNTGYDKDTKTFTGSKVKVYGNEAGKATLTATIGGKSVSMTITVWDKKTITSVVNRLDYTIRDGSSDLLSRFQTKYPTVLANVNNSEGESLGAIEVPITWEGYDYSADKKTVSVRGYLNLSDSTDYTKYTVDPESNRSVTATATLTNEGEVTSNVITASKTTAVAGDKITFTAKATAEPSDATLAYQWYKNGTPITGATSASYTFTVPEASEDSTTEYKFTCGATATRNNTTSAMLESNTVTLSVSRDYSIELTFDNTSAKYTVGETPKVTAAVYKWNGSSKTTVSNVTGMSWELLDASTEKSLSSNIATVSGSGTSASVTTKATGNASGQKITVQATVSINGYTYTGKKDITLSAATASFTMSVGDGSAIKATTIQSKAKTAAGNSSTSLSYVKFDTPQNCTLTKSSSSSTAIGSTACYFSTTTGQKLSDVYVKLSGSATSGSVVYTVYDTNDNAVVTGTITFDSAAGEGSITCVGVQFDDADVVEMIEEEFSDVSGDVEYVKFDALASKYGRLLTGYKGIIEIDAAKDVSSSDKYYLNASGSQNDVEDIYLLPRTDYYGTIEISYTAYSSSNKSLGEGKLTFTVVRKTASSKFTDVTAANVGSWAADAIDFMAENNLVGGTGNNKFTPTGTMIRGDLVLIMYRMAGQPSVTGVENPFTDVTESDYYYKAVLWAYQNGVVNGTGVNTFGPKSNITREQIATILYRYSGTTAATGSITSFTDASSVSDYALTAMKWAVGAGIIGGSNNKLNPQGNATRAEVAVMLHRFLNK